MLPHCSLPVKHCQSVIAGAISFLSIQPPPCAQDQAAKSASRVAAFCERTGYHSLEMLVSKFQGRVLHGVKPDAVALTTIKGVKGVTARLLYTAGLQTVEEVASADAAAVHKALVKGKKADAKGGEWAQARRICAAARRLVKVRVDSALSLLQL